jgi:hypothetical protein
MTIEVTGCHDCPFRDGSDSWCNQLGTFVVEEKFDKTIHPSCPLKQETITIKLKEDEKSKNH